MNAITNSLSRHGPQRDTVDDDDPVEHDVKPATDTPTAPCTPCHTHPVHPLPSPEPLDADDARDQSMLSLGVSTIRLVPAAPAVPSTPVLRPFTPSFDLAYSPDDPNDEDLHPHPLPPGGFPGVCSTPSAPLHQQKAPTLPPPPPPPFLFGSPAHHTSNTDFSAAASSVLAEMNARLGLTGTAHQVSLDLLQQQTRGPANTDPALDPPVAPRTATAVTSMFDRAHARAFQKMEGIGEWYARRTGTGASPHAAGRKRKSDALGDARSGPALRAQPTVPTGRIRDARSAAGRRGQGASRWRPRTGTGTAGRRSACGLAQ
ncbi:hypothetical protein JB92DRAFT_1633957 [Gautieria morchelliformis]|nr:hypothetical protein JB92DRAFT_1633957 [Gautieria morchelliformis]